MTSFLLLMALSQAPVPEPDNTVDPATLRQRIDHNMKASEEKLRRQLLDAETTALQRELLQDIDRLLNMKPPSELTPPTPPPSTPPPPSENRDADPKEKPSMPQPGPGGEGERTQQPAPRQNSGTGQGKESRRERRERQARGASQSKSANKSSGQPSTNERRRSPGERPGEADGPTGTNPDQARGATMPPANGRPEKMADVSRDVWGHLPESLRQEVDHYYKERFMPRYRELLQQYYNRLAESERKPEKKP